MPDWWRSHLPSDAPCLVGGAAGELRRTLVVLIASQNTFELSLGEEEEGGEGGKGGRGRGRQE